jgi:hypothetical protein
MAALTALKSTNFDLDIILLLLFDCDELCSSRSEPLPNGILSSAGKISRGANLPILASPEGRLFYRNLHNLLRKRSICFLLDRCYDKLPFALPRERARKQILERADGFADSLFKEREMNLLPIKEKSFSLWTYFC